MDRRFIKAEVTLENYSIILMKVYDDLTKFFAQKKLNIDILCGRVMSETMLYAAYATAMSNLNRSEKDFESYVNHSVAEYKSACFKLHKELNKMAKEGGADDKKELPK